MKDVVDLQISYPILGAVALSEYQGPAGCADASSRRSLRLSYRDVEELLAERGIEAAHVTVYRWVQRFTPLLIGAARPCRHVPGEAVVRR
jgi:hypothetical protein